MFKFVQKIKLPIQASLMLLWSVMIRNVWLLTSIFFIATSESKRSKTKLSSNTDIQIGVAGVKICDKIWDRQRDK